MINKTERVIRNSQTAEELVNNIDELKAADLLDTMQPELRAEVERSVRDLGSHGMRGPFLRY